MCARLGPRGGKFSMPIYKNIQEREDACSARAREGNIKSSQVFTGSSLGQRNGGVPTWVDLAGIDPRDQTQGI